jgi:hypothetical protein
MLKFRSGKAIAIAKALHGPLILDYYPSIHSLIFLRMMSQN